MQRPESEKLLSIVAESCRDMNIAGRFTHDQFPYLGLFQALLEGTPAAPAAILDFGSSAGRGIATQVMDVVPYDPHVPELAADPWTQRYRAVYSTDVLEHMVISQVVDFLRHVSKNKPHLVFLAVATRPASKLLNNGINAHLIVESPAWWWGLIQGILQARYDCVLAWGNLLEDVCILAFRLKPDPVLPAA